MNQIKYTRTVECIAEEEYVYETDLSLDEVKQKAADWIGGSIHDISDGEVQDWLDAFAREVGQDIFIVETIDISDEKVQED